MATPAPAPRPGQLHGCWATWSDSQIDNVVKTQAEDGSYKTRRRFTGKARIIEATVTYPRAMYQPFMDWFNINQQQGAVPTLVREPLGTEITVQWLAPPTIDWLPGALFFKASVRMLER